MMTLILTATIHFGCSPLDDANIPKTTRLILLIMSIPSTFADQGHKPDLSGDPADKFGVSVIKCEYSDLITSQGAHLLLIK